MNDSFGGGGFNANTTTTGGEGTEKKDGVLPVVIKQLLLAEDHVSMFDFNYSMVCTHAIVRKIDYSATKVTYRIEDHTGQIDAHFWIDSEDNSKQPKVTLNAYAKIVGGLRNQGDSKVLIIYHAEEVTDPNQITTHLLEVLYARYKSERYRKGKENGIGGGQTSFSFNAGSTVEPMETGGGAVDNPCGLTGKQLTVYQAIRKMMTPQNTETGIKRQHLDAKFQHIPKSEMDAIIEFMSSEGIIYTTIDADHFLPCEV